MQRKAIYLTNFAKDTIMPKIPTETEKRISPAFQERLLELIDELECTKYQFAAKVQVSVAVITRATIYGIIPSLKILIKLADYLNVPLLYLLGETDERSFDPTQKAETFHVRLQQLTEEKQTKYSKIAHTMPFSKNFFYEWQRTKTLPSLDYLKALAEYFKVSVDYLLGRTDYRD